MKIKLYIILLMLSGYGANSFAQKTTYNWFFGNKAGITFNQEPPKSINTGALSTFEGCSSISDGSGKLLFYSNGIRIFNRNNEIMLNGNGLLGDLSSTSNTVIAQQPGSANRYYLFNVSAAGSSEQSFTYSVIDMSADNGLGAVIEKNSFVQSPAFEKIAAVRHCNKVDVWIMVKGWQNDEYYSYLLTSTGLNITPVVSNTGFSIGGLQNNMIGAMKFSADGKHLAAAYAGEINSVQLANFNSTTGKLSNAVDFTPNNNSPQPGYRGVYGLEFSPDGKLLYVSSANSTFETMILYQFDITLPGASAIRASRQIITQRIDWAVGGMQLGPDQKIYVTLWKDSALSVIESPNVFGPACNFLYNEIPLLRNISSSGATGYISESGLPGFVSSDLLPQFAGYQFTVKRENCTSKDVQCLISYTDDIDSVKWDFGDGQASTLLSPTHTYPSFGSYTIGLIIYRKNCTGTIQLVPLSQNVTLSSVGSSLPGDTSVCDFSSITIRPKEFGDDYLWSTGEKSDSIIIKTPGLYWLDLDANGCTSRDTIVISAKPAARLHLGNDTTVCTENPIVIKPPLTGNNYEWNDGSTGSQVTVRTPGNYYLKFENAVNCFYTDTLDVEFGNCEIYFPTAFTPNGDGINDQFGLINHTSAKTFELQVYNRYGQVVYQTNDQFQKWDGTINGKKQQVGTYAWIMRYRPVSGLQQIVKGTVLLIR